MRKKNPYFHHNWQAVKDTPAEDFTAMTFKEFELLQSLWSIPSSVECIMRITNLKTGKVKEHVYRRRGNAENKIRALVNQGNHEFVICDHETVHHLFPLPPNEKKNRRN
tara:strand:+ start:232 stop:558 length:327 start_codon:yes stop_codon:yes gene_type:complete